MPPPFAKTSLLRSAARRIWLAIAITAALLACGFPLLWMVRGALIDQATWMRQPLVWVPGWSQLSLSAFAEVLTDARLRLLPSLATSFVIATFTALLNVIYCSAAGFALAKMPFKGRAITIGALVLTLMVPLESMMISLFLIVGNMGLFNTLSGILLPMSVSAFNIILMWRFFKQLPDELIEAAMIDGAGWGTILTRVAVPVAAPAVATIALLSFLGGWDAFIWPMLITDPGSTIDVVQKVIASETRNTMAGGTEARWPQLMATALIATLPMLLLFQFGQRYFVAGLTQGSVKE